MSFRTVCIAVGILSFSLTFAVSSWQRGLWRHRTEPMRTAVANRIPGIPASWHNLPRTWTTSVAAAIPRRSGGGRPPDLSADDASTLPQPAASNQADPSDLATLVVPVSYFALRDPDRPGTRIPTLTNVSANTLEISVIATDAPTGAQLYGDLTIKPWGRANLAELGLPLQPGDEITLRSPPYQDQSFTYQ